MRHNGYQGPLLRTQFLTLFPIGISNYIHHSECAGIVYTFPNSNVTSVEIWKWITSDEIAKYMRYILEYSNTYRSGKPALSRTIGCLVMSKIWCYNIYISIAYSHTVLSLKLILSTCSFLMTATYTNAISVVLGALCPTAYDIKTWVYLVQMVHLLYLK